MKKTLMAGAMVALLLCCTGCGKKLVCSGDLYGMDTNYTVKFNSDDKATSATVEFKIDVKDYLYLDEEPTDDEIEEAVKEIEEEYEDMDEYENVKVTHKGSVITIKASHSFDEDDEMSYDETKEELEDMDLTCK